MNTDILVMSLGFVQILTLILCGVLSFYLLRQEQLIRRLRADRTETSEESHASGEAAEEKKSFQKECREAEMRASLHTAGSTRHSPTEKYKYVACMADKGLDTDDLARSFGISSYEAEQLVNLSRLASRTQS